jgi:hypothetical protein
MCSCHPRSIAVRRWQVSTISASWSVWSVLSWWVVWLVGWSIHWVLSWWVEWLGGRSIHGILSWWVEWLVGWSIHGVLSRWIEWLVDRSIHWVLSSRVVWLVDRSIHWVVSSRNGGVVVATTSWELAGPWSSAWSSGGHGTAASPVASHRHLGSVTSASVGVLRVPRTGSMLLAGVTITSARSGVGTHGVGSIGWTGGGAGSVVSTFLIFLLVKAGPSPSLGVLAVVSASVLHGCCV